MSGNKNQARIYGFVGSSGCGKTYAMMKMLTRPKRKRTLVWSPKEVIDNYASFWPGALLTSSVSEVVDSVSRSGSSEFHSVFMPSADRKIRERQFHVICQLYRCKNFAFIAEELHTVTRPNWAPDGWSEMVLMGRGFGVEIFGCSQRPASMDKDFFGNCSMVRSGRLGYDDDEKVMAKALRVPVAEVRALTGFQFIQYDQRSGVVSRG
jgi:hypothetical protein